ncbi:MAG TPA: NADH-quinone oxidoreductase subunit C [Anaeromyxobacteraceae bacterium]|nr:NADH-quinone oxidoreductase subunit C [Anaeromyxobacteraceae bacterium]
MTTNEIHERLKARFGDDVGAPTETKGDPWLPVKRERLVEVCRFLKETPGLDFDFCEDLTAVDWPKRSVIEVVVHLLSYQHKHALKLKVEADRAAPVVDSLEGVWKTANWFEREVYDLFGVTFTHHPDLRRIMLPDDWVGFPLRKDYEEAGGWHGIDNVRENPLVELKRLDDAARAEAAKNAPPPPPAPAAPPAAPAPTAKS